MTYNGNSLSKFYEAAQPVSSFYAKLLTDRQTYIQTDRQAQTVTIFSTRRWLLRVCIASYIFYRKIQLNACVKTTYNTEVHFIAILLQLRGQL